MDLIGDEVLAESVILSFFRVGNDIALNLLSADHSLSKSEERRDWDKSIKIIKLLFRNTSNYRRVNPATIYKNVETIIGENAFRNAIYDIEVQSRSEGQFISASFSSFGHISFVFETVELVSRLLIPADQQTPARLYRPMSGGSAAPLEAFY